MSGKLFEVIKLMESRHAHFRISRVTPTAILIDVAIPGARIEISVGEDDEIEVSTYRGDETIEAGIDAVVRALGED